MPQNKYFNPGRFARLFRNDLLINHKIYFLALAGLAIAIYAFTFFFMQSFKNINVNDNSYYIGPLMVFILVIWVVIGTSFPMFRDQIKASHYLVSPGSTFEKFMVQLFIRVILFILIAMLLFWGGTHLAKASLISYQSWRTTNDAKHGGFDDEQCFQDLETDASRLRFSGDDGTCPSTARLYGRV